MGISGLALFVLSISLRYREGVSPFFALNTLEKIKGSVYPQDRAMLSIDNSVTVSSSAAREMR